MFNLCFLEIILWELFQENLNFKLRNFSGKEAPESLTLKRNCSTRRFWDPERAEQKGLDAALSKAIQLEII